MNTEKNNLSRLPEASAELYLDPRPKASGLCNVKIRVYFNRKYKNYSTDIDLKDGEIKADGSKAPSELDKILTAKRRTDRQKDIYVTLNSLLLKAVGVIKKLDTVFTFEKFDEMYLENRDIINSVSFEFDKNVRELEKEERIATATNYRCAKNSLEDFKKGLKFADITPSFLKDYERWMLSDGKSVTTVGIYLRALRSIFNQQDIDSRLYPFGKGKYEIPTGENIKKALTLEEIAKIYNYDAQSVQEATARDYWMFLYLCNGMNVKDFCNLQWKDIDRDILTYQREKTKRTTKKAKKITVSLKPETWQIINKYGKRSVLPEGYIFPHYHIGITPTRKQEVSQQLIKNINKYMKQIVRKVGINKNVTTYFARHSFATILKTSGTNISMISDLLGHSNVSVTENYLSSFENEQIKKQTDALLSFNKKAQ